VTLDSGRAPDTRRILAILAASAALQLFVACWPDTMGDLLVYRIWTRTLAGQGLAFAYWPPAESVQIDTAIDYPPLVPYGLLAIGRGLQALSPASLASDRLLDLLIRAPFVASLLAIAWLVAAQARRNGGTGALACAAIAFNPALLFDTAYWGQADAPSALLIVSALVSLVRARPEGSAALLAAAALVKPRAYVLAPLFAFEILRRFGPRRLASSIATALATALALVSPFAVLGRFSDLLLALTTQLDAMPFVTVNAHNLWWIATGGPPWVPVTAGPAPLLSWTGVAAVLFGVLYLATLVRLARSHDPDSLYVAAASLLFGMFVLGTHMHENHLFAVLPVLALAAPRVRAARALFAALTLTLLANMALHDPFLTHLLRPAVPGPHVLAPARPGLGGEASDWYVTMRMPWIVEQVRGETSLLGFSATLVNAAANLLLFLAWLKATYGPRRFDAESAARSLWPGGRYALASLALVAALSWRWLVRAG
jgi:Gpi18-like mannosyltransferase